MNSKAVLLALAAGLALTLSACEQEGPAERAGEHIDNAVGAAGDKIEQAGDKIEEAGDKVKEKVQ